MGVVEPDGRAGLRCGCGFDKRRNLAVADMHELLVELHFAYFGDPGHAAGRLVEVDIVIEIDDIPAVQACGARPFFVPFVYGEQALQCFYADIAEHGIEVDDARTGGDAARPCNLHDRFFDTRNSLFAEIDQQFALDCVFRREYELGGDFRFRPRSRCLLGRILGARTQYERQRQEQQAP